MDFRSDIKRAVAEFTTTRQDVETATFRALNRTVDAVGTASGREIRKVYNVKQRAITSALRKRRASRSSLFASLIVEGVKLGLIEFDARWSRKQPGASVKIKVGDIRKTVAGSFIAAATRNNARGGGSMGMRQVFRRVGKERYPIRTLKSISVPQAFSNQAVLTALQSVADTTFNKNLLQQIRYLGGA